MHETHVSEFEQKIKKFLKEENYKKINEIKKEIKTLLPEYQPWIAKD